MNDLHIRPATCDDACLLWEWANDPVVRACSFSQKQIPWDVHLAWLDEKLADPACHIYILVAEGVPVTQVRFELKQDVAVVSMSVATGHRRKGYGRIALDLATQDLCGTTDMNRFEAFIKRDNTASRRLFSEAGYGDEKECVVAGFPAIRTTLLRSPR